MNQKYHFWAALSKQCHVWYTSYCYYYYYYVMHCYALDMLYCMGLIHVHA